MHDLRIFPDQETLSRAMARELVQRVQESAAGGRRLTVALTGGSTPRALYELLAAEYRTGVPWSSVHLFWSDERYVPLDHPDSNYRAAREALLDRIEIPPVNLHAPPTGLDRPDEAAHRYERAVRDVVPSGRLDSILFGLGEDGHFASLFPQVSGRHRDRSLGRRGPEQPEAAAAATDVHAPADQPGGADPFSGGGRGQGGGRACHPRRSVRTVPVSGTGRQTHERDSDVVG